LFKTCFRDLVVARSVLFVNHWHIQRTTMLNGVKTKQHMTQEQNNVEIESN